MDLELKGKIALVTGAASGVGREIARTLAAEGAVVAVNYRSSTNEAEALTADIVAHGGNAKAFRADIADGGCDRQQFWWHQHPDQQCRFGVAQAFCRDDLRGLAPADR
jgi:NAD(P)-dependent dehydrogenase (short-subunit alcohol dehydrogenase family)